jgi:hypothetical protein
MKTNSNFSVDSSQSKCKPLLIEGQRIGWIRDDAAAQLKHYPDIFIEHANQ